MAHICGRTRPLEIYALGLALVLAGADAHGGGALTGDPLIGEREYVRCIACHSPQRHRTGPKHCGLIGRKAGTLTGFVYSKAMQASGIVWDAETLDKFLAAPLVVVPGTKMGYAGVKDTSVRRHLVAYLVAINNDPSVCG